MESSSHALFMLCSWQHGTANLVAFPGGTSDHTNGWLELEYRHCIPGRPCHRSSHHPVDECRREGEDCVSIRWFRFKGSSVGDFQHVFPWDD